MSNMSLLTRGNAKTVKGEDNGYLTYILHLAPSILSGYNVCPMATVGCSTACLNTAGRGRPETPLGVKIQNARVRKTKLFFEDRKTFFEALVKDIRAAQRKAVKEGMNLAIRLNGTSDIRWEMYKIGNTDKNIFEMFPDIIYYDYTKIFNRKNIPKNYHLTFSRAENNDKNVKIAIANGMNVAVVFKHLPTQYMGLSVIPGDANDLRFLDPKRVIIGLKAKGRAKKDTSGFVVNGD